MCYVALINSMTECPNWYASFSSSLGVLWHLIQYDRTLFLSTSSCQPDDLRIRTGLWMTTDQGHTCSVASHGKNSWYLMNSSFNDILMCLTFVHFVLQYLVRTGTLILSIFSLYPAKPDDKGGIAASIVVVLLLIGTLVGLLVFYLRSRQEVSASAPSSARGGFSNEIYESDLTVSGSDKTTKNYIELFQIFNSTNLFCFISSTSPNLQAVINWNLWNSFGRWWGAGSVFYCISMFSWLSLTNGKSYLLQQDRVVVQNHPMAAGFNNPTVSLQMILFFMTHIWGALYSSQLNLLIQ